MCDLYRVKFTDMKGIERQFSDLTLDEVAKVFMHSSLLKPFDVSEMRNGKAM